MAKSTGKRGSKKIGRNMAKCLAYRTKGRRERERERRTLYGVLERSTGTLYGVISG